MAWGHFRKGSYGFPFTPKISMELFEQASSQSSHEVPLGIMHTEGLRLTVFWG